MMKYQCNIESSSEPKWHGRELLFIILKNSVVVIISWYITLDSLEKIHAIRKIYMLLGIYMLPLAADKLAPIYEYGPKDVTPVPEDPGVYLNLRLT